MTREELIKRIGALIYLIDDDNADLLPARSVLIALAAGLITGTDEDLKDLMERAAVEHSKAQMEGQRTHMEPQEGDDASPQGSI